MNDLLEQLQELLELNKYEERERLKIIKIMTLLKGYSVLVEKFTNMSSDCDQHIKTINNLLHSLTIMVDVKTSPIEKDKSSN